MNSRANKGGAKTAAQQIRDLHYCDPFLTETPAPQVIAMGIGMDDEGKGLTEYDVIDI